MELRLGERSYDLSTSCLVMGILNRTPDSFYDKGATFHMDALLRRAEDLVCAGADILDIGGVKAGPGPEVSGEEELERVVPAVEAVCSRLDVPVSVDTWRASVARAAFAAGAVLGNDISGFSDRDYLQAAREASASVVATHIRLAPRVHDPDPRYENVVGEVCAFLQERGERAEAAGIEREKIVIDAGLDLGKTPQQSLELLKGTPALAALGYPVLLSASNKPFLGVLLDLAIEERREASLAAVAMGIALGCRVVRVHDVAGTIRVRETLRAVLEAR